MSTGPRWMVVRSKDGKTIVDPCPMTRKRQSFILRELKKRKAPSPYSFSGNGVPYDRFRELSTTNRSKSFDLARCYEHIKYTRVVGLLRAAAFSDPVALARFCCFNGSLARGSICSPYILEVLLRRLDFRLHGLAKRLDAIYGRYYDDFVISGGRSHLFNSDLARRVNSIVKDEGFRVNWSKYRSSIPLRPQRWNPVG